MVRAVRYQYGGTRRALVRLDSRARPGIQITIREDDVARERERRPAVLARHEVRVWPDAPGLVAAVAVHRVVPRGGFEHVVHSRTAGGHRQIDARLIRPGHVHKGVVRRARPVDAGSAARVIKLEVHGLRETLQEGLVVYKVYVYCGTEGADRPGGQVGKKVCSVGIVDHRQIELDIC